MFWQVLNEIVEMKIYIQTRTIYENYLKNKQILFSCRLKDFIYHKYTFKMYIFADI